jgi:hypothetical protein
LGIGCVLFGRDASTRTCFSRTSASARQCLFCHCQTHEGNIEEPGRGKGFKRRLSVEELHAVTIGSGLMARLRTQTVAECAPYPAVIGWAKKQVFESAGVTNMWAHTMRLRQNMLVDGRSGCDEHMLAYLPRSHAYCAVAHALVPA